MSKKELVLVVSRTLSLWLVAWALVELTYLPERLFSRLITSASAACWPPQTIGPATT